MSNVKLGAIIEYPSVHLTDFELFRATKTVFDSRADFIDHLPDRQACRNFLWLIWPVTAGFSLGLNDRAQRPVVLFGTLSFFGP